MPMRGCGATWPAMPMIPRLFLPLLAALSLGLPAPARADEAFELWLNPSVATELDSRTGLELETAQRLRSADDQREDTYFFRLWLTRGVAENATLGFAAERRINDGGRDETRIIQQLSSRHGFLRTRLRLEQRMVDGNGGRMGLRVRSRLGVQAPLDTAGRWAAWGDAELFLTLRPTSVGGNTGATGLRTQLGITHDLTDSLTLSAAYLRQEDFDPDGPNRIGHAPIIGIGLTF